MQEGSIYLWKESGVRSLESGERGVGDRTKNHVKVAMQAGGSGDPSIESAGQTCFSTLGFLGRCWFGWEGAHADLHVKTNNEQRNRNRSLRWWARADS